MGKKVWIHTVVLLIATLMIFLWVSNEDLNFYSLQLSAVLLLTLIISHRILMPVSFKLVESTVSTMAVLLVVCATGGVGSPLFFLNYFLLFELSFLLEPVIPLLLSGAFICFYLLTSTAASLLIYAEMLAFPFMTPLAVIFGNLYQKAKNQKKEIANLNHKVQELEEELVNEEVGSKSYESSIKY